MEKCLPVQQKVPCVFVTGVQDKPSSKRAYQPFRVIATDQLNPKIIPHDIDSALVTEKVDGTCCLVQEYQGKPWLWARLDRRPSKAGEKKFQLYEKKLREWQESAVEGSDPPLLVWDPQKDFRDVPDNWIPAAGVELIDGVLVPDKSGHTPGWVPVEKGSRQYCWHLTAIDLENGLCLLLKPSDEKKELVIKCCTLSEICGKTCELIGTNINGNPYGLGIKKQPIHVLVVHGSLPAVCPSPLNRPAISHWFSEGDGTDSNAIEGVVWHCPSGKLFKLHRNHLNLPWPIKEPHLSQQRVKIDVNQANYPIDIESQSQFSLFAAITGQSAVPLCELNSLFLERT